MTNFYCRAWVRNNKIYTLHTDTNPIEFNTFEGWCHNLLSFTIEGEYTMAGDVISKLSYIDGTISSDVFVIKDIKAVDCIVPSDEEIQKEESDQVRLHRDYILSTEVDPIAGNALRWAALTADQQAAWAAYRQELLDISKQVGFPHSVVWPVKPA